MKKLIFIALMLPAIAFADVRITTWNIEHLGSNGRGFGGGFGAGSLPLRTDAQLRQIADFIENDLQADVLAVQEIAVTGPDQTSIELDKIIARLGNSWRYILADEPTDAEMVNGFIWNNDSVTVLQAFTIDMPNIEMAGKNLFDRMPVVLYFETIETGQTNRNDIVLINVHMASGQTNDENHAIAMISLEHALTGILEDNEVKESDRVILGDFNDNPHKLTAAGNPKFINTLYQHMERKKYTNLVAATLNFTRMDSNLSSLIDHILVNNSAKNQISSTTAVRFTPGDSSTFADWRQTFSDHFPLSFMLEIEADDDVDFED